MAKRSFIGVNWQKILINCDPLTTCDHQSEQPEIRETGTPRGVSNKVGDLSPLVYIRKRACGAFFGMHAFGAACWLRAAQGAGLLVGTLCLFSSLQLAPPQPRTPWGHATTRTRTP